MFRGLLRAVGLERLMWAEQVQIYGRLIKFSHTIFALPFALAAILLAHRQQPISWSIMAWILLAMAAARSAAMGFNRFADYEYDRRNPRTVDRPLPSGQITKPSVLAFILISSAVFVFSAAMLGRLCLVLSVPVLLVLFFYSYTKRFTPYSHLFLGLAIGLAPVGAWIGVAGTLDVQILPLSLALMTYIAGFDILYACQDVEFDREQKLFSIPACHGIPKALRISSLLHLMTFLCLFALYFIFHLGAIFLFFMALISLLLILEHKLVHPDRLAKINIAFFHVNSVISVLLFVGVWADTWFS